MRKLAKFIFASAAALMAAAAVKAATVVGPVSTEYVMEEGVVVSTNPIWTNYVGSGVTAAKVGTSSVTVTISGGSGMTSGASYYVNVDPTSPPQAGAFYISSGTIQGGDFTVRGTTTVPQINNLSLFGRFYATTFGIFKQNEGYVYNHAPHISGSATTGRLMLYASTVAASSNLQLVHQVSGQFSLARAAGDTWVSVEPNGTLGFYPSGKLGFGYLADRFTLWNVQGDGGLAMDVGYSVNERIGFHLSTPAYFAGGALIDSNWQPESNYNRTMGWGRMDSDGSTDLNAAIRSGQFTDDNFQIAVVRDNSWSVDGQPETRIEIEDNCSDCDTKFTDNLEVRKTYGEGAFRFYDSDASHYIAFKASETVTSTMTIVLPAGSVPSVGQIMKVTGVNGTRVDFGFSSDATGGGGSGTTINVKDGGSSIVDTSTINFTGAQFIVTDDSGESLVALDPSSATLLGAEIALMSETSGVYVSSLTATSPITLSGTNNVEGAAPIIGLTQNAGTDITADLEEEAHASEHQNGGADEISVAGLDGLLADPQEIRFSTGGTFVSVSTGANFIQGTGVTISGAETGNRFDLTINSTLGTDISAAEIANGDHGDFTYSGGVATLDNDVVAPAEMADADHGDFTYSGGVATLDADVVAAAEMADADHGDISWSGGVASVDADAVALGTDTTGIYVASVTVTSPITLSGTNNAENAAPILALNQNAGTDITADLEEEAHASEHQDGGVDEIAVTAGMMNTGTGASATTFWRGDNTWATPGGSGDAVLAATQTWSGRNVYTSTQGIRMTPNAGTGSTAGASGAFLLDCTNAFNGTCAQVYRNDTNTQGSASALMMLMNDATSYNTNMLWILSDSTSTIGGNADINIHANNPDIEFRELDRYTGSNGNGQWEIDVNNDELRVNFRDASNSSFQTQMAWNRNGPVKWKELDDGGDYISFQATNTMSTSHSFVWPADTPSTGEVLKIQGTSGGNYNLEWATDSSGGGGGAGVSSFTYTFNPDQAKLPGANPCVISNSTNAVTSSLLCDDSTDESVTWSTTLTPHPGGTLKVAVFYSMVSATSGTVDFEASLMCVSDGDSADIDTESFAAVGSGSATVPGTAGYMDVITITPTDDSCAAGDLIVLKLNRDANDGTNDTASGDTEIRKVRLYAE